MKKIFVIFVLFALAAANAQDTKSIKLLPPQTELGKPVMQAMLLRQSQRSFESKPLPLQELSNLLWAAAGINRPESGKRTTPSAMNRQEVDVYAFLPEGVFLYNPQSHTLDPVSSTDLRSMTSMRPPEKKEKDAPPSPDKQPPQKTGSDVPPPPEKPDAPPSPDKMPPMRPSALNNAPLVLVFIADEKKLGVGSDIQKIQWSSAAAGFMIQNVYLYCASQGLASVVRASFDNDALIKELHLRPEQRIVLVQSVGYPK